ncbi:MAG: hypothetical protein J7647_30125 [Cyanobacteria bacterium SBLK]|nr:hypothetical protein [Cyanobacteria bacterium SBLK]
MNRREINPDCNSPFKLHLDRLEAIADEVKLPRWVSLKLHLDELEAIADELKIRERTC